jgi:hypothetical protein
MPANDSKQVDAKIGTFTDAARKTKATKTNGKE